MAFIAYYYHWSEREIAALPHRERRRWCEEISFIHTQINPPEKREKSILEMRPL